MKSILILIRPEWVVKILNGEKTIEVRKTAPKCELPIDVYIYCTKGKQPLWYVEKNHLHGRTYTNKKPVRNGKIVAKFKLRFVEPLTRWKYKGKWELDDPLGTSMEAVVCESCVPASRLAQYVGEKGAFEWIISDLQIFDWPKDLSEFGLKRAPQSWQYVEAN